MTWMDIDRLPKGAVYGEVEGQRRRGLPRTKPRDNIADVTETISSTGAVWIDASLDRIQWRWSVEQACSVPMIKYK